MKNFYLTIGKKIQENRKIVWISVTSMFSVGLLVVAYLLLREYQYREAYTHFFSMVKQPIFSVAGTDKGTEQALDLAIEKIEDHEQQFTGDKAQIRAKIYLINYLAKKKAWGDAEKNCRIVAKMVSLPELKAYFYFRSGMFAEQEKDFIQAKDSFAQAGKYFRDGHVLKATALLGEIRARRALKEGSKDLVDAIYAMENTSDEIRARALFYHLSDEKNPR